MGPTADQRSSWDADPHSESILVRCPAVVRQADLDSCSGGPSAMVLPMGPVSGWS